MKVRLTRSSNWSYVREEKSARLVGLADRRQQLLVLRRGPDVELKLEVCVCVCVWDSMASPRESTLVPVRLSPALPTVWFSIARRYDHVKPGGSRQGTRKWTQRGQCMVCPTFPRFPSHPCASVPVSSATFAHRFSFEPSLALTAPTLPPPALPPAPHQRCRYAKLIARMVPPAKLVSTLILPSAQGLVMRRRLALAPAPSVSTATHHPVRAPTEPQGACPAPPSLAPQRNLARVLLGVATALRQSRPRDLSSHILNTHHPQHR